MPRSAIFPSPSSVSRRSILKRAAASVAAGITLPTILRAQDKAGAKPFRIQGSGKSGSRSLCGSVAAAYKVVEDLFS